MDEYNLSTRINLKYLAEVKSVVSNSWFEKRNGRQWESFRLARTRGTMVCKLVINCFACPGQKRAKGRGEEDVEEEARTPLSSLFSRCLMSKKT